MMNVNSCQGNFSLTFFYISGLAALAMDDIKSSPVVGMYVISL